MEVKYYHPIKLKFLPFVSSRRCTNE